MDFGEQMEVPHDGDFVTEGSLAIGIRDVYWIAQNNDVEITNSEDIDDFIFKTKLSMLPIGAGLARVSRAPDGNWVVLNFDNNFSIKVDSTNKWGSDSDLFEITTPGGLIVILNNNGKIELLKEKYLDRFKIYPPRFH